MAHSISTTRLLYRRPNGHTKARARLSDNLVEDRDSDRPETDDGNSLRTSSGARGAGVRAATAEARYQPEVVVSDPYIDLHTGPGRGYPIFYVAAQGDRITILKEQTEWYKMRTPRGKEGWVTRLADVEHARSRRPADRVSDQYGLNEFGKRRWVFGFGAGDFGGARILSATGSFAR